MNYQKISSLIVSSLLLLGIFFFSSTDFANAYYYNPADGITSGLVPCNDNCTFDDIFRLTNNLIEFSIKFLIIPIFVVMIMYAGYQYITALGNPAKVANLKSMFFNMLKGLVLILCAFLIVKSIMYALGYTESLMFFE
jgi:hypothetical protein